MGGVPKYYAGAPRFDIVARTRILFAYDLTAWTAIGASKKVGAGKYRYA